jgi:hypothetical protein
LHQHHLTIPLLAIRDHRLCKRKDCRHPNIRFRHCTMGKLLVRGLLSKTTLYFSLLLLL